MNIAPLTDRLLDATGIGFQRPFWLLAIVIPILMLMWVWKRRNRRIAMPYDHRRDPVEGRGWWRTVSTAESLLPACLGIVILILALPLTTGNPITERSLSNIEFCVDCSGSMTAEFGEGNRYDASMKAINEFIGIRQGDAFGLTFFASDVIRWCPLTTDSSAFRCALPFMAPDSQRAIGGGTSIGRALLYCRKVLAEQETGDRMIILVSDGQSGDLYNNQDIEIGRQLAADRIVVYGIHIGDTDVPEQIMNLTGETGGTAFVSGDPAGLDQIFRRIDEMRPAEMKSVEVEQIEHFGPFCLAALSVLGLSVMCSFGLRYTPW
ncbi:MAG: VWA domain-containing protein [Planctomyces sp.]|nr:VWA domain-containing protein [Planctomyces sp.]